MSQNKHTPGPWIIATSNSYRRILSFNGSPVCEPTIQRDGHPDLSFANGGQDGPDARLIAAAPELLTITQRLAAWDKKWPKYSDTNGTSEKEMNAICADATALLTTLDQQK